LRSASLSSRANTDGQILILAGLSWCVTTVAAIAVVFFPAQQIKSLFSYEMWMFGGTLCFVGMAGFFFFVYGRRRRERKLATPASL